MAIHVALNHVTSYQYDRLVGLSPQLVRLRPAPHCRTPILSYSLRITPKAHFINWQQDPQSNYLARLTFPERVKEFRLEVDLVAELAVYNPFDFFLEPHAEAYPFSYDDWQLRELQPYLRKEALSPQLAEYLGMPPTAPQRTIDFLVALNQRLQTEIKYLIRLDPGIQTIDQTLESRSGSCRDTTWLLVQLLRHRGLAARFVSGYLIQLSPDVKALDGPTGVERDFTDLHAWCEVYLPGAGWIGLDPTSGLLAGEGHVPLSCTPEPASAAPVTGAVDESEVEFHHAMSVRRIFESPRVTKPYSEQEWQAIVTLGRHVDAELQRSDVRLTMGGEPTFVSVDDRDGEEWTTAALGHTKRLLAADLLHRLHRHYGVNGFVHFGQGKWYPGEQLPRWALGCYWRKDGEAAWREPRLVADERSSYGYGPTEAERFVRAIAVRLGVGDAHVQAGYEDVWYYLWRERRLPVNVDPFDSRLDDELERERLRRVFTQGLQTVVGYTLPLRRTKDHGAARWQSGAWFIRDERLYLFPGDSPMGYRLPLDSLPWASAIDRDLIEPQDPMAPREPLPPLSALRASVEPRLQEPGGPPVQWPVDTGTEPMLERGVSVPDLARTALCAETRNGVLYVFMPPVSALEDYLELVAAVEATAGDLGLPVLMEGYPPPSDHRLLNFVITPDPGVLEVNIQPARNWDEVVEQTTTLYEEAHQTRLSSEKFLLDGRHTGTGGGNHFVLGGVTPADSPFLRRPDLLRSLVGYWHNHPSLSYLFSGLFLGPTSQAPRVDEARHDSVYELEIAFDQIPTRAECSALARRSRVPPSAGRRDGQHPSSRVLHRQAVCARERGGPPGPGRDARVRDAAARPHERRTAVVVARPGRPLLARTLQRTADPLGNGAPRPLHAPLLRRPRFRGRSG